MRLAAVKKEKEQEKRMKGILRYLRDYKKKESVLAPLFKMLEACFELLIPIVMAHIIDTGIKNQDMGYVLKMCIVMVALGIIGLVCSLTAQYFSAKSGNRFWNSSQKRFVSPYYKAFL